MSNNIPLFCNFGAVTTISYRTDVFSFPFSIDRGLVALAPEASERCGLVAELFGVEILTFLSIFERLILSFSFLRSSL